VAIAQHWCIAFTPHTVVVFLTAEALTDGAGISGAQQHPPAQVWRALGAVADGPAASREPGPQRGIRAGEAACAGNECDDTASR
jgi:hypothetical protein